MQVEEEAEVTEVGEEDDLDEASEEVAAHLSEVGEEEEDINGTTVSSL